MMDEGKGMCFECLERRIKLDWSDQLQFCYGISDSPLPFGSSAVVQFSHDNPSASPAQFILSYLPTHTHHCFSKYISNQCISPNGEETQISSESGTGSTCLSDSLMGGFQFLSTRVGYERCACDHCGKFSCLRTITALAPLAHVGISSSSTFQELASSFLSGILEDHILYSLNLLVQGKAAGRDGVNYLHLLGFPSFDESSIPGCLRHPNVAPVLGLLKTHDYINLLLPKTPYSLENILHYSPNALKSDWHMRFLMYQLLSALTYLHGLGVLHGNLCPSNVMLTDSCWAWLRIWDNTRLGFNLCFKHGKYNSSCIPSNVGCCIEDCLSQGLYADLKLSPPLDWNSQFNRWWRGELSNFEYLLFLNKLVGRRWGDHTFHPVMPWVIDFSTKPSENSDSGWRDLSKSKWRLAKGDEQLDFTYSTSEVPHHVSDECLSELAVCSYKARRLPLSVLRMAVRSVYEPNEYPSTMQRLYQWTPDECIPFTVIPGYFTLNILALESNQVSSQIHYWIDINLGYKMSGPAAVAAKNVMLSSSEPTKPRSIGRRQLFTQPHPARRVVIQEARDSTKDSVVGRHQAHEIDNEKSFVYKTSCLQELEETSIFSEHARHLSPLYFHDQENLLRQSSSFTESQSKNLEKSAPNPHDISEYCGFLSDVDLNLLEHIDVQDDDSTGYQELLLWRQKSCLSRTSSKEVGEEIFSVGCLLAELYLRKPLFCSTSLATYLECGVFPALMQELPSHVKVLVEACIEKDWTRRPSAKSLLESPFFPSTVKSVYLFTAPLQLLATDGSRHQYAANFAKQGALKTMGTLAAEMCAPYCLPLASTPLSDAEAECAYTLLKEFIKCLTPKSVKALVLPVIQKILQASYSHLKVSLLQDSFVLEIWNQIGKQTYLETIHPSVISNLYISPHKSSAAAASVLLICSSEELGEPITVHQTILPLIHCFGKGLCPDGIDVLVVFWGETFILKQMLPLLKHVAHSSFLPREAIVKDLIEDKRCVHALVLMQTNLEITVLQVAATTLMAICQRIGPELTALHVLPQLKVLFDELAFSQEGFNGSQSLGKSLKDSKSKVDGEFQIESRMDLVLLLYPSFCSLLGIEKLRQCCTTGLLLEQFLLLFHNWKWEYTGESSRSGLENSSVQTHESASNHIKSEPWFWFPSPAASWDGSDLLGRFGGPKDEFPWKIRASVLSSVHAHQGALRSLAICQDENTVFTAGIGPGFKGTVQKWDLARINCVVNDICVLSMSGRIASCDGTVHVWDSQTGKLISVFSEPSMDSLHLVSSLSYSTKISADHVDMSNSNTSSSGVLGSPFDESLYTCMHYLELVEKLVVGTGNGSLRFIDVSQGRKLHLWKGEFSESAFPSLVAAICSCGSDKEQGNGASASPSWIAAGLSSGHCRLFDVRSGCVIACWRAHDGYVTKLAAPEDHLLVSSSLDRTLKIWDLRRNLPMSVTFKGHTDGVSSFSVWRQDVISISKNKIGLSSLARSADEVRWATSNYTSETVYIRSWKSEYVKYKYNTLLETVSSWD
ncbi:S-adenosylmethionine synthase family protein [Hibiscus syriacus]|uniref:S-adenosylmethionine synthase family protein n=1 Tax=Hibiscus syriacus TaxID=106335 RepID=A0A6A3CUT1_HIBSY|nr:S-adenosylmethionine synthase family protein [Hibiscus syriacus]